MPGHKHKLTFSVVDPPLKYGERKDGTQPHLWALACVCGDVVGTTHASLDGHPLKKGRVWVAFYDDETPITDAVIEAKVKKALRPQPIDPGSSFVPQILGPKR